MIKERKASIFKREVGRIMRYKRKEPFRYVFNQPIDGKFVIILNHDDENKVKRTDPGAIKIIDLSPRGMQFKTTLDIPTSTKEFYLEISFLLDGETIDMLGKVAWKKSQVDCIYYGFEGIEDKVRQQIITERVKSLSKKAHAKVGILEQTEVPFEEERMSDNVSASENSTSDNETSGR